MALLVAAAAVLGFALASGEGGSNAALLVILAAAPVANWLALPGDRVRRTQSTNFLLIVVAAGIHGLPAAVAVGLTGLALERYRRPEPGRIPILQQAGLLIALMVAAGGYTTLPAVPLDGVLLLAWLGFAAFWFSRSDYNLRDCLAFGAVFAWLGLMLSMPFWAPLVPDVGAGLLDRGVPPLRFALAFMTLDTAFVTGLGLTMSGRTGIQFWRRELIPTFARYNALTVVGVVSATLYLTVGLLGFLASLTLVGLGFVILRDRALNQRRLVATICALSSALDARDPYTKGHSDRVADYAVAIAERLGWPARARRELEIAAHLHDVGKIGIPDEILLHPGRLTDEQFEIIKSHSLVSANIVRNVPDFRAVSQIVLQHHERLDGSGYPHGVSGERLLPAARILGVADAFDAMTSTRSYRPAMVPQVALAELLDLAGDHYDREVVAALCALFESDRLDGALQYGYCLTH